MTWRVVISTHYASASCRFLPGSQPSASGRPYLLVRGETDPDYPATI